MNRSLKNPPEWMSVAKEAVKDDEGKKWTEILEGLSPEDFGKYKM